MDKRRLQEALKTYGTVIQEEGWKAGEAIIKDKELEIPDFRKWAYALGILLRAEEILNQDDPTLEVWASVPRA